MRSIYKIFSLSILLSGVYSLECGNNQMIQDGKCVDLQLDWCNLSGDLVCGLGGTCNNTGNEYECTCRDGWRKRQNIDSGNPAIDKCNIKVCGRRELVCANDEGEEFDREDCACDTLEPACDSNPCENLANTECLNLADFSHECKCLDEFFKQADGNCVAQRIYTAADCPDCKKINDNTKCSFSEQTNTIQPTCISECSPACVGGQICEKKLMESGYICKCPEGENLDTDVNECVTIPAVDPVDAEGSTPANEMSNADNDSQSGQKSSDSTTPAVTSNLATANSGQSTLFILGVCLIVVLVIGVLIWLKSRKDSRDQAENEALNSNA